jgi:hypothetical protein
MTPYERAIQEQIVFLEDELKRIRIERETAERLKHVDERPINWALTDPGFRDFLLRRQFDRQVQR